MPCGQNCAFLFLLLDLLFITKRIVFFLCNAREESSKNKAPKCITDSQQAENRQITKIYIYKQFLMITWYNNKCPFYYETKPRRAVNIFCAPASIYVVQRQNCVFNIIIVTFGFSNFDFAILKNVQKTTVILIARYVWRHTTRPR